MKKLLRFLLVLATVIIAVIYLLSCFTPYINPVYFWPLTFVALGFSVLVPVFILLIVIWLFVNRKVALGLLLLFILDYKNLSSTWGLNAGSKFNYQKDSSALRILDWNVRDFDNNDLAADTPTSIREQMMGFIKKANADVLFFQDYTDYISPRHVSNMRTIRDSLGYKYCYTSKDSVDYYQNFGFEMGCAIYSKFPLLDTGKISYKNIAYPESVMYADIVYNNRKIRIFTTHLESMRIRPHPGIRAEKGKEEYDSAYRYGSKVTKTLKQYDQIHANQAEFVQSILAKSPYPSIITGDFNSVPSSYVYYTIKGNKKDAFLEKGFGLGHSYYALSKTLRIDYVLVDPSFKVQQVTTPVLYLSDHFPVVTDIKFAK